MKNIMILDCTLRDGAQVNSARFGEHAIKDITSNLVAAGIDIVECGFLKKCEFEAGRTYYPQPSYMIPYLPNKHNDTMFAALMDFGRYDVDKLEPYKGDSVDIIRISFFEWDLGRVGSFIKTVQEKGYLVSIQPMDTFSYTDYDLEKLVELANETAPFMLSMVDTYSVADEDDIDRVYSKYQSGIENNIKIGFHSHNNRLNSFGLAKHFIGISADDSNIVCDASLFGMGRGAGNLNTEIIAEYLCRNKSKHYNMNNLLDMIDKYILDYKETYEWGYSMPMLYAGLTGSHVFTASYLAKKHGVTSYDLKCMLERLDEHKKKRYDYDYLDEVYNDYMRGKRI